MYDERIKSLSEADEKSMCGECGLNLHSGATKKGVLFAQAADAIEDLSKPKWISVEERLPERDKYVLVRYANNDMAVACVFGGDEHMTFWRAMTDEGWCADCDTEPTHWMPLPEPPKEE